MKHEEDIFRRAELGRWQRTDWRQLSVTSIVERNGESTESNLKSSLEEKDNASRIFKCSIYLFVMFATV